MALDVRPRGRSCRPGADRTAGVAGSAPRLLLHRRTEKARAALASFGIVADDEQLARIAARHGSYAELFRSP